MKVKITKESFWYDDKFVGEVFDVKKVKGSSRLYLLPTAHNDSIFTKIRKATYKGLNCEAISSYYESCWIDYFDCLTFKETNRGAAVLLERDY